MAGGSGHRGGPVTVVGTYGHADSSVPNGTPAKARTSLDR